MPGRGAPRQAQAIDLTGGADGTRTRDPRRDRPLVPMALSDLKSVTYKPAFAPFNRKKRLHKPLNPQEADRSNGATSCGQGGTGVAETGRHRAPDSYRGGNYRGRNLRVKIME